MVKTHRLFGLILVILLIGACNRTPLPPVQNDPDLASPRNDIAGLPNFAKISDTLYRGAQPTAEGFKELKKMGVKTIINLHAFASDRDLIKGLGFQYLHISFKTWHAEDEDVVKFLKAVTDPANGVVFVHCEHGSDRTGMMVAIYRMFVQGWSFEKAIAELPRFGFHETWQNIRNYLKAFDVESMRHKVQSAPNLKIEVVP